MLLITLITTWRSGGEGREPDKVRREGGGRPTAGPRNLTASVTRKSHVITPRDKNPVGEALRAEQRGEWDGRLACHGPLPCRRGRGHSPGMETPWRLLQPCVLGARHSQGQGVDLRKCRLLNEAIVDLWGSQLTPRLLGLNTHHWSPAFGLELPTRVLVNTHP